MTRTQELEYSLSRVRDTLARRILLDKLAQEMVRIILKAQRNVSDGLQIQGKD